MVSLHTGTVTHMPLELLREGKLSQKVDVYSFGVLLWEMCVSMPHPPLYPFRTCPSA